MRVSRLEDVCPAGDTICVTSEHDDEEDAHDEEVAPPGSLGAIAAEMASTRAMAASFFGGDVEPVGDGEVLAEALRRILKAIDRDEIIEDFVDSNALAFAEHSIDAEQRLEWAPLYNKYVELVELVIKGRLDELDCSAEDLFKYARRYSDEDPGARRLLRKVHALEEYREFCGMMQAHHRRARTRLECVVVGDV